MNRSYCLLELGQCDRVDEASPDRQPGDARNAHRLREDLREVFPALFPDGLRFTPARVPDGERQIWRITGAASFSSLVDQVGPDLRGDPDVLWRAFGPRNPG